MRRSWPSSQRSQSRRTGTLQTILRGIARRCAFTLTRVRGTQTPATATTAECSSLRVHGPAWVVGYGPTGQVLVNSFIERGGSIYVTLDLGANGARQKIAVYREQYARALSAGRWLGD